MALAAARRFSNNGDFDKAFGAYRCALDFKPSLQPTSARITPTNDQSMNNNRGLPFPASPPRTWPAAPNDNSSLQDAVIFDELAQLCFDHGHQTKAALFYEKATWMDRENVQLWYRRGAVYQAGGDIGVATKCFERCLSLDADCVEAMFHLGILKHKLAEYRLALEYFLQLLQRDPQNTEAMIVAAECYDSLGMSDEALVTIAKVLEIDPSYLAAKRLGERFRSRKLRRQEVGTDVVRRETLNQQTNQQTSSNQQFLNRQPSPVTLEMCSHGGRV